MQTQPVHIRVNLIHIRNRCHRRVCSLNSFRGIMPTTVGKIAPVHQCSAELRALRRKESGLAERYVTPATIAKLRKIKICEDVLLSSFKRSETRWNCSTSLSRRMSLGTSAILQQTAGFVWILGTGDHPNGDKRRAVRAGPGAAKILLASAVARE